jgi:hypothetical protein
VIALVGFSGPDVRASESFAAIKNLSSSVVLLNTASTPDRGSFVCTKQKKLSKQIPADAATALTGLHDIETAAVP